MTEARTLLADYVNGGSDDAFRELVARYIGLVYSTALRRVDGDSHLAEDIAQTVFLDLARQANGLSKDVMLGGWLHQRACHGAATVIRSQRRRQARERQAMELKALRESGEPGLDRLAPVVDEVVGKLGKEDRHAIILRFFEQRDFRSIGEAMGTKEDAARMRVTRALEKLRALLLRRGVTVSIGALATALAADAATAAPTGLAASVAATALAGGAVGGTAGGTLFKLMIMTKLKAGLVSAILVAVLATPLVLSHQSRTRLQRENLSLRAQLEGLEQINAENQRLSNLLNQASNSRVPASNRASELLRLRGETGVLRRQIAEMADAHARLARQTAQTNEPADPVEQERQKAIVQQQFVAKMGYSQNWLVAFHAYAQKNEGRFPSDFAQASSFLPDNVKDETLLATNQFDILYQGSLRELSDPANAIVLREYRVFPAPSGGWLRTYGFADGHSEVHKSEDGNFAPWEAQHMLAAPGAGAPRQ